MTFVMILVGLGVGVMLGMLFPGYFDAQYTTYVAVALLAGVDTVLGGLNAQTKQKFRLNIFITGFVFNVLLAVALTWFGNLLSLDLYLAAVVVFGTRIFHNLAELRRMLLQSPQKNDKLDV